MSSAKWRALQHRHRYTYTAVVFPPSFLSSLPLVFSDDPLFSPFHSSLLHFTSLSSTLSQLSQTKQLANTFLHLLQSQPEPSSEPEALLLASSLYLHLLFLENSHPLHKTLLSPLAKTTPFRSTLAAAFQTLLNNNNHAFPRFAISRAVLSVLGMPKLDYLAAAVENCAVLIASHAVDGLEAVLAETSRPSPVVMEQCQEALSCLYYLLQKFPSKFCENEGCEFFVMEGIVSVVLSVLSSASFSRDCFVAAGVTLCAALQVCVDKQELGLVLIRGVFDSNLQGLDSSDGDIGEVKDIIRRIPCKGDLYLGICGLSVLSRLCLIRGILTAVSRDFLNAHFSGVSGVKTVLYDGILPELCRHCENPVDSHFNFHALTVMQICLQQIKTSFLLSLTDLSGEYEPIPEEMGMRILRIII